MYGTSVLWRCSSRERAGKEAFDLLGHTAIMTLRRVLALVVVALVAHCNALPASAAKPAVSLADAGGHRSPSMIFSSPTNGEVVPFLSPLYIHGTAFDSDGVVTQVLYFV